jgi:DNA-binding beta-propeller fold protein YncE
MNLDRARNAYLLTAPLLAATLVACDASGPTNQAPVVEAGADQRVLLGEAATLSGDAGDDGLPNPPGALELRWSQLNGPGEATFADVTQPETTASFSTPGAYTLQLSASDGALTGHDRLTVTVAPAEVSGRLYVFPFPDEAPSAGVPVTEGGVIYVYDMDDEYRLLETLPLPELGRVWGVHAHAETGVLYIAYEHADDETDARVLAYDLVADEVIWSRSYRPFVDSLEVTPDGTTVYLASGESEGGDFWFVLDAATGDEVTRIETGQPNPGPHNTIVGLSGDYAYLAPKKYDHLFVVDTTSNEIIREVGPFSNTLRPFTVNSDETLAVVAIGEFSGFEVADLATGRLLHSVEVEGFPWRQTPQLGTQSHGVALTPDEHEIWVVDAYNSHLHVFDATGLPATAPEQVASIPLGDVPKWLNFSRDGRYAHVSTGEVVDTQTREVAFKVAKSKQRLQIDFVDERPVAAYSRYGLGYATAP